ncbi:hypothetical protein ACJZ2D_014309 [Fusarium nematophilum]
MNGDKLVQATDGAATGNMLEAHSKGGDGHALELSNIDLSHLPPPPSPPLQPTAEESSLEDDEFSQEAPLPPLGVDMGDLRSIAAVDATSASSPTNADYNGRVKCLTRYLAD